MEGSEGNMSLKNPVTPPGIDPGTVRLVAQRLNHYATPGPNAQNVQGINFCRICQALRVPGVESLCSREGLLILYVVQGSSEEFDLHANDMKLNMQNDDVYRNFMFNVSCVFVYTSCAIKYKGHIKVI